MKRFLAGAAVAALGLVIGTATASAEPAPTQVTVETGALQGAVQGDVLSFKGIPFAAPPVGDLRWRPPQPAAHWEGVRQATEYGHDCMQKPFPSDAAPLGTQPSEDCLVMNVWRPAEASNHPLPVMVWIYGGGFVNGGSSPAVYAGDQFAKQGIVFVSFNYRLGRFGFFGFPALTKEHPDELKGDYAYMDQIAALKWVKANIAAFGGDPNDVTVFGESAGGGSVNMLLTSPLARGLFERAGIESGFGRTRPPGERRLSEDLPNLPSAEIIGVNFAKRWGIEGDGPEALAKLRALSAEQVTDGYNMASMFAPSGPVTYSGPIEDGRIVVGSPDAIYAAGTENKVPVLIGVNGADGFSMAKTMDAALAPMGPDQAKTLAVFDPNHTGDVSAIGTRVGAVRGMAEPARFLVTTVAAQGVPTYEYRFVYVANTMRGDWKNGAPHATEIPYVFDTVQAKYGDKLTPQDEAVAQAANHFWGDYAKTGDPNGPGLPNWPRYDRSKDEVMVFRADGTVGAEVDPWQAQMNMAEAQADAKPAQ